jgi:hypothetical protein
MLTTHAAAFARFLLLLALAFPVWGAEIKEK